MNPTPPRADRGTRCRWLILCLGLLAVPACGRSTTEPPPASDPDQPEPVAKAVEEPEASPREYEASADALLQARLPSDEAREGWIRLFDGHTLFGWEFAGEANWRVEEGAIRVDAGPECLLCTSTTWNDYELTLEVQAEPETNSGVFLRTPLQPEDPAVDCLEVNIAPPDNPFPTGSVVARKRVDEEQVPVAEPGQWRRMTMWLQGDQLTVSLDGEVVRELTDFAAPVGGRIGLQKNSGPVAFRDIRLRPLGFESLLDEELSAWKRYPEMSGRFETTEEGWLHVIGGKTQLESRESYGDFTLLAEYKLASPEINSGIFFRCIPGDEMMGYECQISNEMIDGDPLRPADAGTGGIFRRQDARIVAGRQDDWSTVVLAARGPHFAAWVNGIQVSDVADNRSADENPRRGLRLAPGTLMIQGHDAETDALYRQLKIAEYP